MFIPIFASMSSTKSRALSARTSSYASAALAATSAVSAGAVIVALVVTSGSEPAVSSVFGPARVVLLRSSHPVWALTILLSTSQAREPETSRLPGPSCPMGSDPCRLVSLHLDAGAALARSVPPPAAADSENRVREHVDAETRGKKKHHDGKQRRHQVQHHFLLLGMSPCCGISFCCTKLRAPMTTGRMKKGSGADRSGNHRNGMW